MSTLDPRLRAATDGVPSPANIIARELGAAGLDAGLADDLARRIGGEIEAAVAVSILLTVAEGYERRDARGDSRTRFKKVAADLRAKARAFGGADRWCT